MPCKKQAVKFSRILGSQTKKAFSQMHTAKTKVKPLEETYGEACSHITKKIGKDDLLHGKTHR